MALREFTRDDWSGLAGSEPISDTQPPLVSYDLVVTDWPEREVYIEYGCADELGQVTLVVDAGGIWIGGIDRWMILENGSFRAAKVIAEDVLNNSPLTVADLEEYGFVVS
jgi:hypothetical protein